MNPDYWRRINRIYHEALKRAGSRRDFLVEACAGDENLRKDVERLLASHEQARGFLEAPAMELAAKAIAADKSPKKGKQPSAQVVVTITQGPRKGKSFVFARSASCIFGRANDCFEILPEQDPTVGRHHFALEIEPPKIRIRDLGSLNGTYVNGQKLTADQIGNTRAGQRGSQFTELEDGDKFQAGDTAFKVSVEHPIACARCGRATPARSPAVDRAWLVLCDSCVKKGFGKAEPGARPAPVEAEREGPACTIQCCLCQKAAAVAAEVPPESDYVCDACQANVERNKLLLRKMLNTTGRGEPSAAILPCAGYDIKKAIGKGSRGIVYLIRRKADGRRAVMKVIFPKSPISPAAFEEFRRAMEQVRALRHPNLAEQIDCGSAGGAFFVVSELCDAGTLEALVARRNGRIGLHEALPLMQQVLEAMAFCHEKDLWHGNLTPRNILLCGQDGDFQVRVSDLGIEQVCRRLGAPPGGMESSACAAPGPECGPSDDVWDLGALFHFMLTGKTLRRRPEEPDRSAARKEFPISHNLEQYPEITPDIAQLIKDALSQDARVRCRNAGQMLRRLRAIQTRVVRLTIMQ